MIDGDFLVPCIDSARRAGRARFAWRLERYVFMDSIIVQYVLFVLAALILIWAVIVLNKRLYRRNGSHSGAPNTWMKLDTRRHEAKEEPSSGAAFDDEEEEEEIELHARARQNGHHTESQKPPL